jgi:hypothetical protein
MGFLIGMDEAGYGPNYGPLVVAATAWEVPEGREATTDDGSGFRVRGSGQGAVATKSALRNPKSEIDALDLYRLLRGIVAKSASEQRIAIADSKALYKPGLGLRQLERGLHAVLATAGEAASCWSAIVEGTNADPGGHRHHLCWHDGFECELPVDATADELSRLTARFARACGTAEVRPLIVRARYIFPAEFNELVERYGSKGAALSHVTVGLLRAVMNTICPSADLLADNSSPTLPAAQCSPPRVFVLCDKHGGRNYYAALLQHHFSEHWIEPVLESHVESHYAWGPAESRVRVVFRMQGERFLPTALASMTAKYLRELAMRPFNEFWCARVPGLRPTAGYPVDSHRFRKAIFGVQRELRVDDHLIWRNR